MYSKPKNKANLQKKILMKWRDATHQIVFKVMVIKILTYLSNGGIQQ